MRLTVLCRETQCAGTGNRQVRIPRTRQKLIAFKAFIIRQHSDPSGGPISLDPLNACYTGTMPPTVQIPYMNCGHMAKADRLQSR